jgi:hypothetical protein
LAIDRQSAFDFDSRGGELIQELGSAVSRGGEFNDLSSVILRKSRQRRQPDGNCKWGKSGEERHSGYLNRAPGGSDRYIHTVAKVCPVGPTESGLDTF